MCRYAFHNYRDHFACFRCRKSFKDWQYVYHDGIDRCGWFGRLDHEPREVVCPDCSRPMVDMGLDFKAPPKRDRNAWRILERLAEKGVTFHGCGCDVGFKPPRSSREVTKWLEHRRERTEGESLLGKFRARSG